jgi:hypothetical protein
MSVLVYAFATAAEAAPKERGLDGKPLRLVSDDVLAAVVSDHDQPRLASNALSLWGYEQVMEQLLASRTILPARFGTVLADDEEVVTLLHDHRDELTAGLERVRGAVELGTRARWRESDAPAHQPDADAPAAPSDAGPGTAYMAGRVALHRRAQDLARRLDPLAGFARDVRRHIAAEEEFPVREAYLVDRDRLASFAQALRDLDERDPEIEMVCTGPWPPYSFARAIDLTAGSGEPV